MAARTPRVDHSVRLRLRMLVAKRQDFFDLMIYSVLQATDSFRSPQVGSNYGVWLVCLTGSVVSLVGAASRTENSLQIRSSQLFSPVLRNQPRAALKCRRPAHFCRLRVLRRQLRIGGTLPRNVAEASHSGGEASIGKWGGEWKSCSVGHPQTRSVFRKFPPCSLPANRFLAAA